LTQRARLIRVQIDPGKPGKTVKKSGKPREFFFLPPLRETQGIFFKTQIETYWH